MKKVFGYFEKKIHEKNMQNKHTKKTNKKPKNKTNKKQKNIYESRIKSRILVE